MVLKEITSTSYQSESLKEGKEHTLEEQKQPQKTVILSPPLSFLSPFSPFPHTPVQR